MQSECVLKTSTSLVACGANVEDIPTMSQVAQGRIKIKASGGIRTLRQALALIEAGAHRLGASVSTLQEFTLDSGST